MKRFLFSLVGLFFAYICFIHVWASLQPPLVGNVYWNVRSLLWDAVRYYTGQTRWITRDRDMDDIPRFSSLVVVDGHIYVRVSLDKLSTIMGWSKHPEEWRLLLREKLAARASGVLEGIKKRKESIVPLAYRLYLDAPVPNVDDIESFEPYDPQSDRLYMLLDRRSLDTQ